LRGRRAEAEGATQPVGCKVLSGSGSSGNKFLGGIGDGHSANFPSVPLKDVGGFTIRVASGGIGGDVEFRQGSLQGALLATIHVDPTGGWDKWVELKSAPITPVDSRADVVAVFKNPGKGGLMNLDWVQFDAPKK
jgi:cytochrome c